MSGIVGMSTLSGGRHTTWRIILQLSLEFMATVLVLLSPSDDDVVVQNGDDTSGSDSSSSGSGSWSFSSIGLDSDVGDGNENTPCDNWSLPVGLI